jgi:hypothetical protein
VDKQQQQHVVLLLLQRLPPAAGPSLRSVQQKQKRLARQLTLLLLLRTAMMHLCFRQLLLLSQSVLTLSSCSLPKSCHLRAAAAAASATEQVRQAQGLLRQRSVPQQQLLLLQQALVWQVLHVPRLKAMQLLTLTRMLQDPAALTISMQRTQSQMLMQQQ